MEIARTSFFVSNIGDQFSIRVHFVFVRKYNSGLYPHLHASVHGATVFLNCSGVDCVVAVAVVAGIVVVVRPHLRIPAGSFPHQHTPL